MSAICGLFFLDGRPAGDACITSMVRTLAHRGPDGATFWQQGATAMGHLMLRTTPESLDERLPLVDEEGRFVLTGDARIDNGEELTSLLGLSRPGGEPVPDSRLVLEAYKRWGEAAPEHLVGDFAFVVWDARRQSLFCARDPLGIRPLYYYHRPDGLFAFASELKALVGCSAVVTRLNEARVADHLRQEFDDTKSTFYQDVFRLPAAHTMTVSARAMRIRRYWSLDTSRELNLGSDQEYADAFREVFVEAVRCRTRSSGAVGSTLSGGLDSSSIACTANLVLGEHQRPLHTCSAVFPGLPAGELRRIDERHYMDTVLQTAHFDPSFVHGDRVSPLLDWQRALWHLDEAFLAPNLYLHWGLYKAAAAQGVRVLLDGLDGDTAVSHGLYFLTDLARAGRWIRFSNEARALSRRYPSAYPFRRVVWQLGVKPLVPARVIRSWRALMRRDARRAKASALLSRSLATRIGLGDQPGTSAPPFTGARNEHKRGLNSGLIPYAMETADKISSSCGLEVRYPFFDRRLVEFCLSIPPAQKLQQGWTRAVMRRGMAGILPEPVRWRVDKSDLSSSFFRGLFERDRETVERVVFSHEPWLSEYVDVSALRSTYLRWAADPMRQGSDALALFGAVTLTLWLETSGLGRSPGVVRSSSEEEPHAHESLGLPDVRAVGTRLGWI